MATNDTVETYEDADGWFGWRRSAGGRVLTESENVFESRVGAVEDARAQNPDAFEDAGPMGGGDVEGALGDAANAGGTQGYSDGGAGPTGPAV